MIAGLIFVINATKTSYDASEQNAPIPLIEAEKQHYKIKATNDDQSQVANLDKEFFNNITKNAKQKNEKLLPISEAPIDKTQLAPETQEVTAYPLQQNSGDKLSNDEKTTPLSSENQASAFAILEQQSQDLAQTDSQHKAEAEISKLNEDTKAKKLLTDHEIKKPQQQKHKNKYRIQIASFYSKKEALEYLRHLKHHRADLIGDLVSQIEQHTMPNAGMFFRVQLGVFTTRNEAKKTCSKLNAAKIDCFVVEPE